MKKSMMKIVGVLISLLVMISPVWATSTSADQNAYITIYSPSVASYATAIGYDIEASGTYSFAIGRLTIANEQDSFAAGYKTAAMGISSTAMGYMTNASGNYSTAFGTNTTANGTNATALGTNTISGGKDSIALGNEITVLGDYSVGVGLADFIGPPPIIAANNVLSIMGGRVGIDVTNPAATAKLAIGNMPNTPPDASGTDGVLCITNSGNVWVDDDGTYDCA